MNDTAYGLRMLSELYRLREDLAHERQTNEKLATSNVRLREERRMLVEALEPFASGCVATDVGLPPNPTDASCCRYCRARAVLEEFKR